MAGLCGYILTVVAVTTCVVGVVSVYVCLSVNVQPGTVQRTVVVTSTTVEYTVVVSV
jgi:hypothetical protein